MRLAFRVLLGVPAACPGRGGRHSTSAWNCALPRSMRKRSAITLLARARRRGGEVVIADKNYRGRAFPAHVQQLDATILRPRRRDERGKSPHLAPIRQRIESIFWTCKDLLTLERHGARTLQGLRERVLARFCCLAAAVIAQPPTPTPNPCTRQLLRLTARNHSSRSSSDAAPSPRSLIVPGLRRSGAWLRRGP